MSEHSAVGRTRARDRLLEAAREMVLERFAGRTSPADAVSYLTPAAVAERAGVSRSPPARGAGVLSGFALWLTGCSPALVECCWGGRVTRAERVG